MGAYSIPAAQAIEVRRLHRRRCCGSWRSRYRNPPI